MDNRIFLFFLVIFVFFCFVILFFSPHFFKDIFLWVYGVLRIDRMAIIYNIRST